MFAALIIEPEQGPANHTCSHFYGPFSSELAARDWALEAIEIGEFPGGHLHVFKVGRIFGPFAILEEPFGLGDDPGL